MRNFWSGLIDGMAHTIVLVCMAVMFFGVLFLCAWMYPPLHEVKRLDCSLVEFSPDVSLEIKKACREARSNI